MKKRLLSLPILIIIIIQSLPTLNSAFFPLISSPNDSEDLTYYFYLRNFIKLEKGNYSLSCVEMSGNFTLEGAGSEKTVIRALCPGPAISVYGGSIILKGLTIVGDGLVFLRVTGKSMIKLLDVRIVGFRVGIELRDDAKLVANNIIIEDFRKAGILTLDSSQAEIGNVIIYSGKGLLDETTGILAGDNSRIELVNTVLRDIEGNGIVSTNNALIRLTNVIVEKCDACAIRSEGNARIDGRGFLQRNNYDLCGNVDPSVRIAKVSQTLKEVVRIPEDYMDLQEAIDAVRPGGNIVVIGGNYPSVTVWKSVNIIGYGSPVIKGFSILKNVRLNLEGVKVGNNEYTGIINYGYLRIINSKIVKNYRGIESREDSTTEFINVKILDNYREGIHVRDNSNVFLNHVIIRGNGVGLDIRDRVALMVSNSIIQDNQRMGINVIDRPFLYLRNVTIVNHSSESGIYSSSSPLILLETSNIENNRVGLTLKGASTLVALNSSIKNNKICDIIYEDKGSKVSLLNSEVSSICPQDH